MSLDIYTDGSHKDGWGSWAFVMVREGVIVNESSGRAKGVSSTDMEFRAATEALKALKTRTCVKLFSDSKILIDSVVPPYPHTEPLTPPSFQESITALKQAVLQHDVKWQWIKAHAGHVFNERCDYLCKLARVSKGNGTECNFQ